jgi:hypothetical protein
MFATLVKPIVTHIILKNSDKPVENFAVIIF